MLEKAADPLLYLLLQQVQPDFVGLTFHRVAPVAAAPHDAAGIAIRRADPVIAGKNHVAAANAAFDQPGKRPYFGRALGLDPALCHLLLDFLEHLFLHQRLMGVGYHGPFFFRDTDPLLRLVTAATDAPLHHISCIGRIFQDVGHRNVIPHPFFHGMQLVVPELPVLTGAGNVLGVQNQCDVGSPHPLAGHVKNGPYHL